MDILRCSAVLLASISCSFNEQTKSQKNETSETSVRLNTVIMPIESPIILAAQVPPQLVPNIETSLGLTYEQCNGIIASDLEESLTGLSLQVQNTIGSAAEYCRRQRSRCFRSCHGFAGQTPTAGELACFLGFGLSQMWWIDATWQNCQNSCIAEYNRCMNRPITINGL